MTELTRLDARTAERPAMLAALDRDGAVILEGALEAASARAILSELEPFIAGTAPFEDDFVGRQTTRTGALVARISSTIPGTARIVPIETIGLLGGKMMTSALQNLEICCSTTVLPAPKPPGTMAEPPRATGNRASRTRWPVWNSSFEPIRLDTGRACFTGQV